MADIESELFFSSDSLSYHLYKAHPPAAVAVGTEASVADSMLAADKPSNTSGDGSRTSLMGGAHDLDIDFTGVR